MKLRSLLTYIGLVLIIVGGARLALQLGLTGLGNLPWAMFAIGILLVVRDSSRQLSERVRVLESQLAHGEATSQILPSNMQLQRTVIPNRLRAASASFHYAHAARWTRGHAAAELRR